MSSYLDKVKEKMLSNELNHDDPLRGIYEIYPRIDEETAWNKYKFLIYRSRFKDGLCSDGVLVPPKELMGGGYFVTAMKFAIANDDVDTVKYLILSYPDDYLMVLCIQLCCPVI